MDDLLRDLNESQLQAVTHGAGPLLILAGPGSGKTRVVTTRIAYLLHQGVDPRQIVGMTFTNKAADEMRHRLRQYPRGEYVWVSTFHRFCSMLLRRYASLIGLSENFTILDAEDSLQLIQSLAGQVLMASRSTPAQLARSISNAKNALLSPDEFRYGAKTVAQKSAAELYPHYQQRLLETNSVDFDDLLAYVAFLLRDQPELRQQLDERYQHVLVDEYQDTNLAQYAIVRAISCDYPNLAVTGDPDQSIYSWRGANIGNILSFERDYSGARVVRLERNYRSTKAILRVADRLIVNNRLRKAKGLKTENDEGPPVQVVEYLDEDEEASEIAGIVAATTAEGSRIASDFAILYRTNALSRVVEHALRREGIPYQIVQGMEFYRRREVKDILAYLHLIYNPRNDVAFLRVINAPPRGIGKVTLGRLQSAAARDRLSLLDAVRREDILDELTAKAAKSLSRFVATIDRLRKRIHEPLGDFVGEVLTATDYKAHLTESEHEEDRQRLANVEELISAARDFQERIPGAGLDELLEQSSLASDTDEWDRNSPRVTLMTLHASKGLEFRHVFIIAVEHNILPHERSLEDVALLEEERRLLFVGMTRAKEQLQVSFVRNRDYRGNSRTAIASRFVEEIRSADVDYRSRRETSRRSLTPTGSAFDQLPPVRPAPLTTAAELWKESVETPVPTGDGPSISAANYRVGAIVRHPKYGLGKVMKLSGTGRTQTGTIQFFQPPHQKSFRLQASPLEPVEAE